MKGLLIKDFHLLLGQKKFFIVVTLFGLFFTISNENPISGMSYVTVLFSIFTLSTISYDEYDNGMAFLMTLPASKTTYVAEKYAFAGMITAISAVISSILAIGISKVMNISIDVKEIAISGIVVAGFASLMLAFMIPIELKFGAEKSRIAMILVMGIFFGVGLLAIKGLAHFGIDMQQIITEMAIIDEKILIGIVFVVWCIFMAISYFISVNIMKKKEF